MQPRPVKPEVLVRNRTLRPHRWVDPDILKRFATAVVPCRSLRCGIDVKLEIDKALRCRILTTYERIDP